MNDTNVTSDPSLALPAVVITGGTEGIGRALAEEFARDGHNLVLVARDGAKLARAAAELSQAYPVEVKATAQDLNTPEGCAGVEQAVGRFSFYAEVLVNNAGVMASGFFQDADPAAMRRMIDERPQDFVKMVTSLLPRDLNVNFNPIEQMTDEQLVERIRKLDAAIRPFLDALNDAEGNGRSESRSRAAATR